MSIHGQDKRQQAALYSLLYHCLPACLPAYLPFCPPSKGRTVLLTDSSSSPLFLSRYLILSLYLFLSLASLSLSILSSPPLFYFMLPACPNHTVRYRAQEANKFRLPMVSGLCFWCLVFWSLASAAHVAFCWNLVSGLCCLDSLQGWASVLFKRTQHFCVLFRSL